MDIELLAKMVAELIVDNDSVGLPGMGSFVAEIVPASFSDRGYTITPPYRKLSFKGGYPTDTLLVDLYAKVNGTDTAEARSVITDFVLQMKNVLKDRKTVIFPGLGKLRATKDNTFFFVSDENLDIFPEGITLKPISLKTHSVSSEELARAVSSISELIAAQPIPQPEPEPSVQPQPEPQPEPEPESQPVQPAPAPEPAPQPAPEPQPVQPEPATQTQQNRDRGSRWWIWPLAIVGVAAVALAVFMILGRTAPDLIDPLLYTPEELRIINY